MVDTSVVEMFERVVQSAADSLTQAYEDALAEMGPRPAGFEQADPLDRLEHFIDVCNDPQGWPQVIADTTQREGSPDRAKALCVQEAGNLLRMLARRGAGGRVPKDPDDFNRAVEAGAQAVAHAQFLRRLQKSEQTLRDVRKLEAKPKAWVVPVPPPPDLTQQLADLS